MLIAGSRLNVSDNSGAKEVGVELDRVVRSAPLSTP